MNRPHLIVCTLKTRRKMLGLSRDAVAKEIGISESALTKWECGERSPTLLHTAGWARALGMELRVWLGGGN
jgi:transcriptional regulator with XRE-family HTH domain